MVFQGPGQEQDLRLAGDAIRAPVRSTRPDGSPEFFHSRWLDCAGVNSIIYHTEAGQVTGEVLPHAIPDFLSHGENRWGFNIL